MLDRRYCHLLETIAIPLHLVSLLMVEEPQRIVPGIYL
jgi:hypothetical protein